MRKLWMLPLAVAVAAMSGCSDPGSAPPGMSADDAKSAIDRMPPEQKIRAIAGSPMPQAEKEQRYAEIEKETGVKAADVLSGKPTGIGAGG